MATFVAYLFLILRIIHITSGVFWAGVAFFSTLSLGPVARSAGPEGGRFMQRLSGPVGNFALWMMVTASLTALTGILMYTRIAFNVGPAWFKSSQGLVLTLAALIGLAGYLHGAFTLRALNLRISSLGEEMAKAGGPPSPAQLAEMKTLQEKQETHSGISSILIVIAVIGMASIDYLPF